MTKIKVIFILAVTCVQVINAQAPYRKIYYTPSGYSTGVFSLAETAGSDFLVISDYGQSNTATYNILLNKVDHNGNPLWAREIGLSSSILEPMLVVDMNERGHLVITHGDVRSAWVDSTLFIQFDTSGNLTGVQAIANFQPDMWAFNSSDSSVLMKMDYGSDIQLVKYDIHGNVKWGKILNEPTTPYFYYNSIEPVNDGSFVLCAHSDNGLAMIRIDSSGGVTLNKKFMPSDTLTFLYPLNFICAGPDKYLFSYLLSKNQHSEFGYLLIDSAGNPLINKVYYSPLVGGFGYSRVWKTEFISALMLNINSSRYSCAAFTLDSALNFVSLVSLTDTNFNDGISQFLCTQGNELLFTSYSFDPPSIYPIQKTDSLANFICSGHPFTVTEDSVILNYSSYNFSTSPLTVAFGPNATNLFVNPVTVTAVDYCGTFLNVQEIHEQEFSIYPNPLTSQYMDLSFKTRNSQSVSLMLADLTGRILYQTQFEAAPGENKTNIFVGDLAKGIYIVTLAGEEGRESVKVIKE